MASFSCRRGGVFLVLVAALELGDRFDLNSLDHGNRQLCGITLTEGLPRHRIAHVLQVSGSSAQLS